MLAELMPSKVYQLLDAPWIYKMTQRLLAAGSEPTIIRKLGQMAASMPPGGRILDVGCGPASWLRRVNLDPWGLDFTPSYMKTYCAGGHRGVVGAAEALPFLTRRFDAVWSIGLLHHLPDDIARQAVSEMSRVCRSDGRVVILDAVMPSSPGRRPLAYMLRRLDRGGYVRAQSSLSTIIQSAAGTTISQERLTYTLYGLELLVASFQPLNGFGDGFQPANLITVE
jgi:ubiquinone/menaquinone biosynthesis C-methylase UbiE